MPLCEVYLAALAAALGLLTALWLVSLALRNSSIVDIFWGAGFVVLGWLYFVLAPQWWGLFLIGLAAGGWMTIFSPLLMTFLCDLPSAAFP